MVKTKTIGGLTGLLFNLVVPSQTNTISMNYELNTIERVIAERNEAYRYELEAQRKPRVEMRVYGSEFDMVVVREFYDAQNILRQSRTKYNDYEEIRDLYYNKNNLKVLETLKRITNQDTLLLEKIRFVHKDNELIRRIELRSNFGTKENVFDYKKVVSVGKTVIDKLNNGENVIVYNQGFPSYN